MFPLFNYNFGLNSRFPSPKAIHPARPNIHRIAEDEPIMSGNDIAAAAVALAATCVIAFFAFRKGKSDKVIKAISGTSPTTPPPASALGTLPTGGGDAVASAISHEPVAVASSSHSASHAGEEAVPVGASSLEHSAADATAETAASSVPAADKPISELGAKPPLPADALVEPLPEPPSSIPAGDALGKPAPLPDGLNDAANKELDLNAASVADAKGAADAANAADAAAASGTANAAASANKDAQTPPPPASGKAPTPPKGSSNPPPPPASSAPPTPSAPPAAGASATTGNVHSNTSFAETQAENAAVNPHTPPVLPQPTTSGTNPSAAASSAINVVRTFDYYEAMLEKGGKAYIAYLEQTPESAAKLDEAMEAWGHFGEIRNPRIRAIFQGQCHELMRNYDKAIASYKEAGAIERLQKLQTNDGLPDGVFEQAEDAMAEIRGEAPRARQPVQAVEPNSAQPNASSPTATADEAKLEVVQNSDFEGDVDALLAKLLEQPFEPPVDFSQPPPPSRVYAEIFGTKPPVTPATAKSKSLPPKFANASPDVLAPKLFGSSRSIVSAAPLDLSRIKQESDAVFQAAMVSFNANNKAAAKEQFETAIGIYKPLLEYDTDGTYFNAIGQCLYGMGNYKKAMYYFEEALKINPNCKEANINLGRCFEFENVIEGGVNDYAAAIEMYRRGGAEKQLTRLLNKPEAQKFRAQAQAALDELNSASQAVVTTTLGFPTTDAPAMMN